MYGGVRTAAIVKPIQHLVGMSNAQVRGHILRGGLAHGVAAGVGATIGSRLRAGATDSRHEDSKSVKELTAAAKKQA